MRTKSTVNSLRNTYRYMETHLHNRVNQGAMTREEANGRLEGLKSAIQHLQRIENLGGMEEAERLANLGKQVQVEQFKLF